MTVKELAHFTAGSRLSVVIFGRGDPHELYWGLAKDLPEDIGGLPVVLISPMGPKGPVKEPYLMVAVM